MRGKLIVIEGTDCSGKETQANLLEENLNKIGKQTKKLYFPKYETATGIIVGACFLGQKELCDTYLNNQYGWFEEGSSKVDGMVSSLYYAADRKYNIGEIEKYLDMGYYVIIDRYTTSNMAHQGGKILDKDERFNMYQWIDKLEFWLLNLPKPDKTIFLHMPYEYACTLKKNRVNLDEHEKDIDHLKNAEEAYVELSELYNWDTIECVENETIKSIEQINDEVYEKIESMIK